MRFEIKVAVCLVVIPLFLLLAVDQAKAELFDFSDGSLQGWSPGDPFDMGFGGTLYIVSTGGNPGPYMRASDSVPGGGTLAAQAPPEVSGDLRRFERVVWDELLPSGAILSTDVLLKGVDGTCYRSNSALVNPSGQWSGKEVVLVSGSEWILMQGASPFDSVLANVSALYIELDVVGTTGVEAGADNIQLVPNPVSGVPSPELRATTWGAVKSVYRK